MVAAGRGGVGLGEAVYPTGWLNGLGHRTGQLRVSNSALITGAREVAVERSSIRGGGSSGNDCRRSSCEDR